MRRRKTFRLERRGVAMLEFALVLPVLMFLLLLMVFFGRSMSRRENVQYLDRHAAWRDAKKQGDPTNAPGSLDQNTVAEQNLNKDYQHITIYHGDASPRECIDRLIETAGARNPDSGDYAQRTIEGLNFPKGTSCRAEVKFRRDTAAYGRWASDMSDVTYREGVPWQFTDTDRDEDYWGVLRDMYIYGFDDMIAPEAAGGGLSKAVQNLYLKYW